jgi:hypothetical protein
MRALVHQLIQLFFRYRDQRLKSELDSGRRRLKNIRGSLMEEHKASAGSFDIIAADFMNYSDCDSREELMKFFQNLSDDDLSWLRTKIEDAGSQGWDSIFGYVLCYTLLESVCDLIELGRLCLASSNKREAYEIAAETLDFIVSRPSRQDILKTGAPPEKRVFLSLPSTKSWVKASPYVILLHGTWARWFPRLPGPISDANEKRWFEAGSFFARKLRTGMNEYDIRPSFVDFRWSGRNTVHARQSAAKRFADNLIRLAEKGAGAEIWIIAHSHAGNVALRALELVKEVEGLIPRIRLVTLATPFIIVQDGANDQLGRSLMWTYLPTSLAGAMLGYLAYFDPERFRGLRFVGELSHIALLPFLALATWCAYRSIRIAFCMANVGNLKKAIDPWGTFDRIEDSIGYGPNSDLRLLVLRGTGDEASIPLSLSSIVSRMTALLASLNNRYAAGLLFGGLGFGILLKAILDDGLASWRSAVVFVVVAVSVSAIPLFLFRVATNIGRVIFGYELIFSSSRVEIEAHSAPDLFAGSSVVTLRPSGSTRHSIYMHGGCIPLSLEWFIFGKFSLSSYFINARAG